MSSPFNLNEQYIDKHLFNPEKPKNGPKTYLNTNYLPHLYHYLKTQLSDSQKKNVNLTHILFIIYYIY